MTLWQAIVLGIVQGITEFLSVSSSGHLLLIPALFGWEEQPLAFDVALHIGTSLAVVGYFWRDWWVLIHGSVRDLREHGLRCLTERSFYPFVIYRIALALVVIGVLVR